MKKKFHDLAKRIVVAAVVITVIGSLVFYSHLPYMHLVVTFFIAAFAGIVSWEFIQLTKERRLEGVCVGATVFTVFALGFMPRLTPFILFAAGLVLFIAHFKHVKGALREIGVAFLGICYVAFPIGLMIPILYYAPGDGRLWLLYLIAVTKGADVGAYFSGVLFGKKKLAVQLSPGKSWEGAIGGFIIGIAISCAFIPMLSVIQAIFLGGILSIFGQVGDLAASLLKRDAGVKDSNSLPGLGGLLDLSDSLLFTTPFLYFFLYL